MLHGPVTLLHTRVELRHTAAATLHTRVEPPLACVALSHTLLGQLETLAVSLTRDKVASLASRSADDDLITGVARLANALSAAGYTKLPYIGQRFASLGCCFTAIRVARIKQPSKSPRPRSTAFRDTRGQHSPMHWGMWTLDGKGWLFEPNPSRERSIPLRQDVINVVVTAVDRSGNESKRVEIPVR